MSDPVLKSARDHAEEVRAWLEHARTGTDSETRELADLVSQLDAALEELQVTEQELRTQNEELQQASERIEAIGLRFEELFDSAPDAYFVTDRLGIVLQANRAASRLVGQPPAMVTGKPLSVFIDEQERRGFRAQLERIARFEQVTEWEISVKRRDGSTVPVAVSALAIEDRALEAVEIRWLVRDVTDRKRAEAHARQLQWEHAARIASEEAERRANFLAEASKALSTVLGFGATVDKIAELAVTVPADYCVVDVLDSGGELRRVAGAHADAAKAKLVQRLLHHPPQVDTESGIGQALRTGEPEVSAGPAQSGDSEYDALMKRLAPRLELILPLCARGRVLGVMTLGISEARPWDGNPLLFAESFADRAALALDNALLLDELVEARDLAQRANEAKAQFLGTLSHEFRTPLTAVIGYSELLLGGVPEPLPDRLRLYVDRIRASAAHQLSLVEQILEYARLDSGAQHVQLSPTDFRSVAQAAVDLVRQDAAEAGLDLIFSCCEQPLDGYTDTGKLRQVLLNLLTNAIQFTDRGEVRMGVTGDAETAVFAVSDTGIGIPADKLARIFDRFWQLDPNRARRTGGAGLGLNISRQLVVLLGGELNVRSQPGVGTTFTVRLPRRHPGQAAG